MRSLKELIMAWCSFLELFVSSKVRILWILSRKDVKSTLNLKCGKCSLNLAKANFLISAFFERFLNFLRFVFCNFLSSFLQIIPQEDITQLETEFLEYQFTSEKELAIYHLTWMKTKDQTLIFRRKKKGKTLSFKYIYIYIYICMFFVFKLAKFKWWSWPWSSFVWLIFLFVLISTVNL